MKKMNWAGIILMLCMSCTTSKPSLEGTWVQSIPGQAGEQGLCLEKGGVASSVNMNTLLFKHWQQQGNQLILSGESIGNRQSLSFSDTLQVVRLTTDSLVLSKGDFKMIYTRRN